MASGHSPRGEKPLTGCSKPNLPGVGTGAAEQLSGAPNTEDVPRDLLEILQQIHQQC